MPLYDWITVVTFLYKHYNLSVNHFCENNLEQVLWHKRNLVVEFFFWQECHFTSLKHFRSSEYSCYFIILPGGSGQYWCWGGIVQHSVTLVAMGTAAVLFYKLPPCVCEVQEVEDIQDVEESYSTPKEQQKPVRKFFSPSKAMISGAF